MPGARPNAFRSAEGNATGGHPSAGALAFTGDATARLRRGRREACRGDRRQPHTAVLVDADGVPVIEQRKQPKRLTRMRAVRGAHEMVGS